MLHVDDKPETLHIYVVREEAPKPSLLPIFLSVLALASLVALSIAVPYEQPVTRAVIRVPAALLPVRTFSATVAVIPTGVNVYPATTAHGILTITNGSVIAQTIPQGFRLNNVVTDAAVFVPAGSANGYGFAMVAAHALISGKSGNIQAYAINQVVGSSIYIRNLTPFHGGHDAYSVKIVTPQDRQTAINRARQLLSQASTGLHYPCDEKISGAVWVTWHCQFLAYAIPAYMHVTGVSIMGKNLLVHVWFLARPARIWVK